MCLFVNVIKQLSNGLFQIEKFIVRILVSVMCLILFAGVALRYVFNTPLYWSGEVAIFALVWVSFIGGSMGIKLEKAATVTIVTDFLNERWQKVIYTIGWAIVCAFCIFLFIYSIKWISLPSMSQQKTDALQISVFYPYLVIPFSFFSLSIHTLYKFLENLSTLRAKEDE